MQQQRPVETLEPYQPEGNPSNTYAHDDQILRSNYVPSEVEVSQLRATIEEEKKNMDRREEELAMLRKKIQQLEREQEKGETKILQLHAAVSAQRRIPVELWEAIFTIVCCSLHEYSLSIIGPSSGRACDNRVSLPPFDISRVCSRWYTIAKRCPSLWDSFRFYRCHLTSNVEALLTTYLANSRGRISRLKYGGTSATKNGYRPVAWNIISGHLSYCKEIHLDLSRSAYPVAENISLPLLESYSEEVPHAITEPRLHPLSQAFQRAPELTDVSMRGFQPTLPYPQLIHLELQDVNTRLLESVLPILATCSRLESLKFSRFANTRNDNYFTFRVCLPSLRTLSIGNELCRGDRVVLSIILSSMIAPLLSNLSLGCQRWSSTKFLPMIQHCSTTLKNLTLGIGRVQYGKIHLNCRLLQPLQLVQTSLVHLDLRLEDNECLRSAESLRAFYTTVLDVVTSATDPGFPKLASLYVRLGLFQLLGDPFIAEVLEMVSRRNDRVAHNVEGFSSASPNHFCLLKDFRLCRVITGEFVEDALGTELAGRIKDKEKEYGVSISIGKPW
ncbi:hypothetical protein PM082_000418 [Marasmius tenuissimus]|nr:hypothetical protein PM082_000418 [Marasmius tenuissimus]